MEKAEQIRGLSDSYFSISPVSEMFFMLLNYKYLKYCVIYFSMFRYFLFSIARIPSGTDNEAGQM